MAEFKTLVPKNVLVFYTCSILWQSHEYIVFLGNGSGWLQKIVFSVHCFRFIKTGLTLLQKVSTLDEYIIFNIWENVEKILNQKFNI